MYRLWRGLMSVALPAAERAICDNDLVFAGWYMDVWLSAVLGQALKACQGEP